MALDRFGLGSTWEDEEEARRKQQERQRQQRLGAAGAPTGTKIIPSSRGEAMPVKTYASPAQTDKATKAQRIDDELTPYFYKVAQTAGQRQTVKDSKSKGVLAEYFNLREKVGEEQLLERFNKVSALTDKYLGQYDISGVVWDMVRSPYSEDQIEFMLRKGSAALYDPSWRHKDVPPVSAKLLQNLGFSGDDELASERVGEHLREWGGMGLPKSTTISPGVVVFAPDFKAIENGVNSALSGVGRLSDWFGKTVGGLLEYGSPEAAIERKLEERQSGAAEVSSQFGSPHSPQTTTKAANLRITGGRGIDQQFRKYVSPGYDAYRAFIDHSHDLPAANLKEMQLELQKNEVDDGNNVIREGLGKDLEADGKMTVEWMHAFEKDFDRVGKETVALQKMLLAQGFASGTNEDGSLMEADGDISSPEWQKSIAEYTVQSAKDEEFFRDDPIGFSMKKMMGDPEVTGGWGPWANRHLQHGVWQALYASGVTAVKAVAGGVASMFALADLNARMSNSPVAQEVIQDAWDYLQPQLSEEDLRTVQLFPRDSDRRQFIVDKLNGIAESDPTAKEKLDQVNVQLGKMITTRFRPNIYTTVGHIMGLPYGEVEKSYENNIDRAEGINFILETIGSIGFGSAVKASRGAVPLARTEAAIAFDARAASIVDRSIKFLKSNDTGRIRRAAEELQGTDAPRVIRTIDDMVGGRYTKVTKDVWNDTSAKVETAVRDGDVGALEQMFPNADVKALADKVRTKVDLEAEPVISDAGVSSTTKSVGKVLRKHQREVGDLYDFDDYGKRTIAEAWAGKGGTAGAQALDVLTRLEAPGIGNPGRIWRAMDPAVARTLPVEAQKLYYALTKPVRTAPLSEVELWRADTSKRIGDYAYQVSGGDMVFTDIITNRYVRAAATEDLNAVKRISDQLAAKANERFVIQRAGDLGDKLDAQVKQVIASDSEAFRLAKERTQPINPQTGEVVGGYTTNDGVYITPPQDTIYQMNKLKLGRSFMWAERRMPEDATKFAESMVNLDNFTRRFGRTGTTVNNRLRAWTVGARPQLFFKHGVVDSARTFAEDFTSIMRPIKNGKKYNTWLDALEPDVANFVRAEAYRAHTNELIYNMGKRYRAFSAERVWKMDGSGFAPQNLTRAADAYRRMASGDSFRAWATGGEQGLRDYLRTSKGQQFLKEGGHLRRAKEFQDSIDIVKDKLPSTLDEAIDQYVDTYMRDMWESLDNVAPKTSQMLKDMAQNKRPLSEKEIKAEMKRIGPDENPYLSMEQKGGRFEEAGGTDVAIARSMTAVWMTPNKLNRDLMFRSTFNNTMDKLVKEGVDPNNAARIASNAARATTERVHFDLANALYAEQKHRWYAWFGTKHRLYATYLARMGAENPMLTLPATTVIDWMEARNAKNNVEEWDKQKLFLDLNFLGVKKTLKMDWHTLTWLGDYPLESGLGQLTNLGVAMAGRQAGLNTKWDPGQFGVSFGAGQGLITTMAKVANSPAGWARIPGKPVDVTEDKLDEWLHGLSAADQEMWNKAINMEMAEAELLHKENIGPVEAYNRAVARTLKHEFWNAFRPFPGTFVGESKDEFDLLMKKYIKSTPKQRTKMLDDHRELRLFFGLHDNPVELYNLDESLQQFKTLRQEVATNLNAAYMDGSLMDSETTWRELDDDYNVRLEKLKRDNPYFNEYMRFDKDNSDFGDKMQMTWPLVDIPEVLEESRPRTEAERSQYETPLKQAFMDELESYGLTEGDTSHPLYKRLKEEMVNRPMRDYTGYDEADPAWKEVTIAKYLARGGTTGIAASVGYKRILQSADQVMFLQAGLIKGKPTDSRPWMSLLSTEQKYRLGWNSSKAQEDRWLEYAKADATIRQTMDQTGLKSTSKAGKKFYGDQMAALVQQFKAADPDWYKEYEVSKLNLRERMRVFGFGDGDGPVDKGWSSFLDTMDDMQADLADLKLTTLDGAKAKPVADHYLAQVLKLKEENPDWWKTFRYYFTMTDFGFGQWKLADGSSDILFSKEVK